MLIWCLLNHTHFSSFTPCPFPSMFIFDNYSSLLLSLDPFSSLFFLIKFQNGAHLKKGYFWPTFYIFSHQGKNTNIPPANHPTYIHTHTYFAHPFAFFFFFFFAIPILQNWRICHGWVLFAPGVHSFFAPFWSNQEITKWWAKFSLECLLLIFYTYGKFIVIL